MANGATAGHARVPVCGFRDGVLFISTPQSEMRIRWQPRPLAEAKLPGRPWQTFWPAFRLVASPGEDVGDGAVQDDKRRAFQAFRDEIPATLAALVAPFTNNQWKLLCLLAEEPAAMDVARTNPVLAWCLANNDEFRGTRPDTAVLLAVGYAKRKQRVILEWLGFPGTEAMVRLMKKLVPEAVEPSALRMLRGSMRSDPEVLRILGHQQRIGAGVLALMSSPRLAQAVTPRLLAAVAADPALAGGTAVADLLREVFGMAEEAGVDLGRRVFSSLKQLRAFHDEVHLRYQAYQAARRHRAEVAATRPLGSPPIPGTADIVPITSGVELVLEGKVQRHCVATYERAVRAGQVYCYQVLRPERATLMIRQGADGGWHVAELRGKANAQVGLATWAVVDNWLARYRIAP